jgi:hypothetical protein
MSIRPEDLEEGEIVPEDEIDEIETISDEELMRLMRMRMRKRKMRNSMSSPS